MLICSHEHLGFFPSLIYATSAVSATTTAKRPHRPLRFDKGKRNATPLILFSARAGETEIDALDELYQ